MHDNRYTQTVDKIKAPESAVEKALETAAKYGTEGRRSANVRSAGSVVSRRKTIRWAVAAVLALVVALGAVLGPGLFGGKAGGAFTITVQAAELAKDSPVSLEAGKAAMNIVGRNGGGKDDAAGSGGTEYYVALPFAISGKDVVSVTYAADKGSIAVISREGSDPVTAGTKLGEGFDTLFDEKYLNDAEKAGASMNAVSRKYSSVTLAAGQEAVMALVGTDSRDVSEFYEANDKASASNDVLAERAARWNELLGSVIHCTVTFSDGSAQQLDIQISFAVMNQSSADPAAFAGLSDAEKAEKDHVGVFVVYSIAG